MKQVVLDYMLPVAAFTDLTKELKIYKATISELLLLRVLYALGNPSNQEQARMLELSRVLVF